MLDRLPERLRQNAEATERATQMLADAKSARNQAAGDPDACYLGVRKEDTAEWQAADELERLHAYAAHMLDRYKAYREHHGTEGTYPSPDSVDILEKALQTDLQVLKVRK